MKTLKISIKALSHPASLAAIVLLLLNDHILKASAPSPFTGKLSDFSGLLFFPFLLSAAFGIPLEWLGVKAKQIAKLCIGITGMWFVGIKLIPAINAATESLAELFTGMPSLIVMDWTDLVALVSLWGTWKIYRAVDEEKAETGIPKVAYLALAAASLGILATSAMPPEAVFRIISFEGEAYVGVTYDFWDFENIEMFDHHQIVKSVSQGEGWLDVQAPDEVIDLLSEKNRFPEIICTQANRELCYRITGEEQLDVTYDGGDSWEIAWEISPGRRVFMERSGVDDFLIYDIEIINLAQEYWLIAAMGKEGVLIRDNDGQWKRVGVETATPSYLTAPSWDYASNAIRWETYLQFLGSLTLYYIIANEVKARYSIESDNRPVFISKPFIFIYILLLIIPVWGLFLSSIIEIPEILGDLFLMILGKLLTSPADILIPFAVLIVIAEYFRYWVDKNNNYNVHPIPLKIKVTITLCTLGIFPFSWFIVYAWAFGWIDSYNIAINAMIFVSIFIGGIALYSTHKFLARGEGSNP